MIWNSLQTIPVIHADNERVSPSSSWIYLEILPYLCMEFMKFQMIWSRGLLKLTAITQIIIYEAQIKTGSELNSVGLIHSVCTLNQFPAWSDSLPASLLVELDFIHPLLSLLFDIPAVIFAQYLWRIFKIPIVDIL